MGSGRGRGYNRQLDPEKMCEIKVAYNVASFSSYLDGKINSTMSHVHLLFVFERAHYKFLKSQLYILTEQTFVFIPLLNIQVKIVKRVGAWMTGNTICKCYL